MQENIGRSTQGVVSQQGRDFLERPASKNEFLASLVIVTCVAVFVVHWPALSAKALSFDDGQYLTENVLVQNPGWRSVQRFLTEVLKPSTVGGYYQPLSMISLMTDYALGGRPDNLRPFHSTSLALHVANTALIIVLLYLLFGRPWIAAAVGLLFGVHPMTVESIPWVGERKTLLAAFFALWCLILYVRYTRRNTWQLYVSCFVMYVLALLSKPTSLPVPVLMLLMDYWPLNRWRPKVIIGKMAFLWREECLQLLHLFPNGVLPEHCCRESIIRCMFRWFFAITLFFTSAKSSGRQTCQRITPSLICWGFQIQ